MFDVNGNQFITLKRCSMSLLWVLICFFFSASARATDEIAIVIINNSGQTASDLHLVFSGGGGNLYLDSNTVFASPCGKPAIIISSGGADTLKVVWPAPCVASGTSVTLIVHSANGPLT